MSQIVRWLVALVVVMPPSVALAQQGSWTWNISTYRLYLLVPSKDDWPLGWLGRNQYEAREKKDSPALWVRHPKDKPQLQGRLDFEPSGTSFYSQESYIAAAGRWYATENGVTFQHFGQKTGEKTETIGKITYTKVFYQWTISNNPATRHHRNVIFVFFEYGAGWKGYGMFANNNYRWVSGTGMNFAEVSEELVNTFLAGLEAQ